MPMPDPTLLFVAFAFLIAGTVKGVIGLGLPTISIGLLAVLLPPAQAAAILIVPSVVTNLWQMFGGPHLAALLRRLWPMLAGAAAGTLAGTGWLSGAEARIGSVLLGVTLIVYGGLGLAAIRFQVAPAREAWLGPLVGLATGLVTAATGVFVIPAVPYLQAIGLEKDELVQALGLSFMVSTLALAGNLVLAGVAGPVFGTTALLALCSACLGMWAGRRLRARLSPAAFRRWFFVALIALGCALAAKGLA